MPVNLATTEAEIQTPNVPGPAGGDPRTASSVTGMGQPLANRTRWLWKRLQDLLGSFAPLANPASAALEGADVTANTFFLTGHGFSSNDPVRFKAIQGGTLPTGVSEGVVYYVVAVNADAFSVSATSGPGAAIDISGSLSGTVYAAKVTDPELFLPTVGSVVAGRLSAILARYGLLGSTNAWTSTNVWTGSSTFSNASSNTLLVSMIATFSSLLKITGQLVYKPAAILDNTDATITVDASTAETHILDNPTGDTTITLKSTSPAPADGSEMRISCLNVANTRVVHIVREDATELAASTAGASGRFFAYKVKFVSGSWRLIGVDDPIGGGQSTFSSP